MPVKDIRKELHSYATEARAKSSSWFFKTGKGQYGEGDVFIGVTVPDIRKVAKIFTHLLSLAETEKLLLSKIHEERLAAIFILVQKYKAGDAKEQKTIYNFYISHARFVNNWDLVDASAPHIVGGYLLTRNRKILEKFATSKNLWEKRIAIVSTLAFIQAGQSEPTFRIATILMNDNHDLIHKACGWMLREVGKRVSRDALLGYLDMYAHTMPRTMLRYSIEHLPQGQRKAYMMKKSAIL